jgi:DtxR family Mn-dependent transcriptional regulator
MRSYSRSIEDYIKAIYELKGAERKVSSSELAAKLRVTPASVTGMMKKIAREKPDVIRYTPHRGVRLTVPGASIALGIIRRHRLIELFLTNVLGYSWDEVHEEAERLEHVISAKFEERLATLLGQPDVDPHGDPIPTPEGTVMAVSYRALSALEHGQSGAVRRVATKDDDLLHYLSDLGIALGAQVTVTEKAPFGGPVHLSIEDGDRTLECVIGRNIADQVLVETEPTIEE